MPRYLVTSGSHFTPFTYDELAKPLTQMAEAQNAAADQYDVVSMETEALRQFLENEPDNSRARRMYDTYMNQLRSLQDNLWENGYNAGTRRQLAQARNGFASNIKPLKDAIQSRMDRSKAYWDMRHSHPELITGSDPGLGSLDDYLNNPNYGQDWYSYSGTQFAKEVGEDVKSQAEGLLSSGKVPEGSEVYGQIVTALTKGFLPGQVNNVRYAIRRALQNGNALDEQALAGLSEPEKILANTVLSHLSSSGANDANLTPEEYNRLVGYGLDALSSGVLGTDLKYHKDPRVDYALQKSLERYRASLKGPDNGSGSSAATSGYHIQNMSEYLEASGAKDYNALIKQYFGTPFEKDIVYTNADGTPGSIKSPGDAEAILNGFGKGKIMNEYGINPDNPNGTWRLLDGQGGLQEIKVSDNKRLTSVGSPTVGTASGYVTDSANPYIISTKNADGSWSVDSDMTQRFNRDYTSYKSQLDYWKKNNPKVNIQNLAIKDSDRKKFYADNNIPDYVPINFVPYILAAKSKQGNVTSATIAGDTDDMDGVRENYARNIVTSFGRAPKDKKGRVAKTSKYAFYPVDGYRISDEGVQDAKEVFGTKKNGSVDTINTDTLQEVRAYPEDVMAGKVRITVNGRQYAIDPSMLGNDMDFVVRGMQSLVTDMMLPIEHPEQAIGMGSEANKKWAIETQNCLGDFMTLVQTNAGGQIVDYISPIDVVMNPQLQGSLRTAITQSMDYLFSHPRDVMALLHMKAATNSSNKGYRSYDNTIVIE